MKINFILPFLPKKPGGGSKIIYEYANRLCLIGHDVTVYHTNVMPYMKYNTPNWLRYLWNIVMYPHGKANWFSFDKKVITKHIYKINNQSIDNADATIGTWWEVAYEISELNDKKGKLINLIQDYEIWTGNEDLVQKSYALNICHVAIADYLAELVLKFSNNIPKVIYNAVDSSKYYISIPIEERDKFTICMLYSEEGRKGTKYGLEALNILKSKYPMLKLNLFGVFDKPQNIDDKWVTYYQNPKNLNLIYNSSSIFLTPSLFEGWALPPAEALQCGCALVATDIGGHKSVLVNSLTGLAIEPKNVEQIVERISSLIENDALRQKMAIEGNKHIQQFDWQNNLNAMISLILEH